jgi:hypothetical protein
MKLSLPFSLLLPVPFILTSFLALVHCNIKLTGLACHARRAYESFPQPEALALPEKMVMLSHGGMLNTCTMDSVAEMLRHLKRAYWPYAWDTGVDALSAGGVGSHGGFRRALLVFVMQLICRSQLHL